MKLIFYFVESLEMICIYIKCLDYIEYVEGFIDEIFFYLFLGIIY